MNKKDQAKIFMSIIIIIYGICANMFITAESTNSPGISPVVEEKISAHGITWMPRSGGARFELRVAPPNGTVFYETFEPGTNPGFNVSNFCGDGTYTYELRTLPMFTPAVRGEKDHVNGSMKQSNQEEIVQSGNFLVKDGVIITGNSQEQISQPLDIVQNDDLIVTGNTCIGSGCATDGSESFGYDSIKIKSPTPRILFDDTSLYPYPVNDWRLLANDTSSGGVCHFSIEDYTMGRRLFTIRAGARSNAFYIDNTGNVGLGTSVPEQSLHIISCDSPTIRLEQTTCFGYDAQKWDLIGNEAGFAVLDYTITSNVTRPFIIEPRAPWYTLYLNSDGKVGINVQDPTHLFQLYGGAYSDGGTWVNSSSRELKENIQSLGIEEALEALKTLAPVKFNYKTDKEEKYVGFIAEDAPELVSTKDHKGMSPMDVVAVLTKVLQEQQKTISELKEKIAELEKNKNSN